MGSIPIWRNKLIWFASFNNKPNFSPFTPTWYWIKKETILALTSKNNPMQITDNLQTAEHFFLIMAKNTLDKVAFKTKKTNSKSVYPLRSYYTTHIHILFAFRVKKIYKKSPQIQIWSRYHCISFNINKGLVALGSLN